MTGLFGVRTAFPELVLFAITIPITAAYQILLQWKVERKLEYLDFAEGEDPESQMKEKDPTTVTTQPTTNGGTLNGGHPQGVKGTGAGVAPTGEMSGVEGSTATQVADQIASQNTDGPRRRLEDYNHPATTAPVPVIWIPQDPLGISKEEIRDTKAAGDIMITDGGATLDEQDKLSWSEDPPDYEPQAIFNFLQQGYVWSILMYDYMIMYVFKE